MRDARNLFAAGMLLLAIFALVACGGDQTEQVDLQAQEDWAWLQQAKQELDEARQEYDELQERIADWDPAAEDDAEDAEDAGEDADEAGEGEQVETLETLEARAAELRQEIVTRTEEFGARLAEFINAQGIEVGGELTEIQQQALHYNSDEAIYNARDYIQKAGEWQRAIDIYRQAQVVDPDYQPLKDAIAHAEDMRYMTEERFSQVQKKMSKDEVRELLGPVKTSNERDFPERNVLGWFYPKEDGGAAGVYFRERKKGEGDWEVYSLDYAAVPSPTEAAEDEAAGDAS